MKKNMEVATEVIGLTTDFVFQVLKLIKFLVVYIIPISALKECSKKMDISISLG